MASVLVNGSAKANGTNEDHKDHLKVLIVGAGIGGLTAAIGLRQQGHEVILFEQSRFANELGAAIHLAPNCHGILLKFGVPDEELGANLMQRFVDYTQSGETNNEVEVDQQSHLWQHSWLLAHRVYLHNALKQKATTPKGKGKPAELRTSSKVVDIDCDKAIVILENGEKFQGDVVIGADGVHSKARSKLAESIKPFSSGKNAFRFLISRQTALDDPQTRKFAEKDGELAIWYAEDRRIVKYPCKDNELLNFVCIHPDTETEASGDWSGSTHKEKLVEVFKNFDPAVVALISKADPETLKLWNLMDMKELPTWVNGRLAVIGDAAHPFLPHQGQGGGIAIEDAASLAVVLGPGTQPHEVPERLKLYEECRYERAHRIQQYTRLAGADRKDGAKLNMMEYTNYNFGHDEWDYSTQKLRKWTWARTPSLYWRMPVAFGPMPGPRQRFNGQPRVATESTFTTASIKFKTSRTLLQNLFPTESFSFKSPGTVAYASFSQTTLGKMEWLGGSGYRHLGLYIHGVQYKKANGEVINGTYMPILFESLTDPIVSGREELGMPKLYTSIDVYRREKSYRIQTGWEGATWGEFAWEGLESQDPKTEAGTIGGEADDGILVYRYIPSVGARGKAEAQYPVFVPHAEESKVVPSVVKEVYQAKSASIKMDGLDWEALPTLHHVTSRLAEIPIMEVVSAKVVSGVGVPDVSTAVRIE
ncbi:MAG: hypothetical protein M1834_003705 [Cirrosporium novae-zelandiae]|nr:MAG: hypothetical protein M1834_003705 [Cirrosporium novae-zelandiae]